jgi:hypothetical protein
MSPHGKDDGNVYIGQYSCSRVEKLNEFGDCPHLNYSLETASTGSTVTASSFSKESDASFEDKSVFRRRFAQYTSSPQPVYLTKLYNHVRTWRQRDLILGVFAFSLASMLVCYSYTIATPMVRIASEREAWKHFLEHKVPRVRRKIKAKSPGLEYTIRLKGSRLDLIQQSIDAHSRCPNVREVQVEWIPGAELLPETIFFQQQGTIVVPAGKNPMTNGVFLLSEDVILSCDDIDRGT